MNSAVKSIWSTITRKESYSWRKLCLLTLLIRFGTVLNIYSFMVITCITKEALEKLGFNKAFPYPVSNPDLVSFPVFDI